MYNNFSMADISGSMKSVTFGLSYSLRISQKYFLLRVLAQTPNPLNSEDSARIVHIIVSNRYSLNDRELLNRIRDSYKNKIKVDTSADEIKIKILKNRYVSKTDN